MINKYNNGTCVLAVHTFCMYFWLVVAPETNASCWRAVQWLVRGLTGWYVHTYLRQATITQLCYNLKYTRASVCMFTQNKWQFPCICAVTTTTTTTIYKIRFSLAILHQFNNFIHQSEPPRVSRRAHGEGQFHLNDSLHICKYAQKLYICMYNIYTDINICIWV